MTHSAHALDPQAQKPLVTIKRHYLKPALADAQKNLESGSSALKRHRAFLEERTSEDLETIRLERDQTQARYDALKSTVDQLVHRIQDIAHAPAKAQNGDIANIRTLLKQAYVAMERQQLELKGIRARTQRIERMSLEQDKTNHDLNRLMQDFAGYQKALYAVRKDMADLVEVVEGRAGLEALQGELNEMRTDMVTTMTRTDILEESARSTEKQIHQLTKKITALEENVHSNQAETEGLSGALSALKEEVTTLNKKFFNYVIDQMRFSRQTSRDKTP